MIPLVRKTLVNRIDWEQTQAAKARPPRPLREKTVWLPGRLKPEDILSAARDLHLILSGSEVSLTPTTAFRLRKLSEALARPERAVGSMGSLFGSSVQTGFKAYGTQEMHERLRTKLSPDDLVGVLRACHWKPFDVERMVRYACIRCQSPLPAWAVDEFDLPLSPSP